MMSIECDEVCEICPYKYECPESPQAIGEGEGGYVLTGEEQDLGYDYSQG